MKYIAGSIIALAGLSNALPHPQYSELPSFALPSATGAPGAGSGSGSSDGGSGKQPKLPAPTGGSGFDLGGLLGGDGGSVPKFPLPTGGSGLGGLLGGDGGSLPKLPFPPGGSGFDLGGLLGGNGGGLPKLPTPTGGSGLGSGFDLGSLFGGGKLPALPSGLDLGGLLGGSGGKLPGLPSQTGGAGSGLGGLLGGGKLPGLPSATGGSSPGAGFDLGSLLGGSKNKGVGSVPDSELGQSTGVVATPTAIPTGDVPAPTSTGATGGSNTGASGTIGTDCKPQAAGRGGSENGVTDKNCCTDMTIIFARGTGELGNVGTVTGPPMFKAIREKLGADRVTVQGVDYPASAGVCISNHKAPATYH
jgi:hypothetical protein